MNLLRHRFVRNIAKRLISLRLFYDYLRKLEWRILSRNGDEDREDFSITETHARKWRQEGAKRRVYLGEACGGI